jgi:hypothetical protein
MDPGRISDPSSMQSHDKSYATAFDGDVHAPPDLGFGRGQRGSCFGWPSILEVH